MSETPTIVKGDCPQCEGSRKAEVQAKHDEPWSDDHSGVFGGDTFRILKCRGCDAVYVQHESWFSEDMDYRYDPNTGEAEPYIPSNYKYWPSTARRKRPSWRSKILAIDKQLFGLTEEVYTAYDADLHVLAAIGVRTTFDRASELLGIDPSKSFQSKLDDLAKAGKIGELERGTLATLTDAGSAAAHRGWRPKSEELDVMLDVIESFLHRNFVLDEAAQTLKKSVPSKPKSKPKLKSPASTT